MQTVTVELLNEYALNLLKDMEMLKLIRVRKEIKETETATTKTMAGLWNTISDATAKSLHHQTEQSRREWERGI